MKKIIDGAAYDTKTARFVARESGNLGNFSQWDETLYCTKKGKYFLHGFGGPASRWSRQVGQNEWSGGEGIEPLTPDEAAEWLEKNELTEELEKEFGPAPEAEAAVEKKKATHYFEPELLKKLKIEAAETGISATEILNDMLRERYQ